MVHSWLPVRYSLTFIYNCAMKLRYTIWCAWCIAMSNTYCVVFCFSLDCPFLIASSVFSNVYLQLCNKIDLYNLVHMTCSWHSRPHAPSDWKANHLKSFRKKVIDHILTIKCKTLTKVVKRKNNAHSSVFWKANPSIYDKYNVLLHIRKKIIHLIGWTFFTWPSLFRDIDWNADIDRYKNRV